ncbi:tRNA (guanine37-N1)-methyltransferase [Halarchaeum rubridurum]|uniref:tRNA (Guanine-N1)-methyltransferase n=1 Tax=Halarchaeum rubridurum TaxID=489911 RepID=A0A830FPW6_9EURY|nr:class I SAM-dependent methyltransferase family protein [Halarchaeum rubridurum]MBP1953154.1 tRNA (guanine37-N1)-methyltransferase [Halarchaeum rubridurum]GGM67476.1 tRNA (guanine-N1)-methyltransferase [Halarchaeum rubridurum]
MYAPCVRVPTEEGEATRRRLADADLVDESYDIVVDDGALYIPVVDSDAVPDDFAVVERDVPERETPTSPADVLGFEPSYERLGDVVILDEDDPARAARIADAIVESNVRAETVVNRASKVKGETRVRDWDVLVGESTETVHREYGCEFALDIAEVYFSPRLATERHRVVQQVEAGEHAFDMFAGVGPYAIPMAKAGAEVVAADINETAIDYLRANAARNDVAGRVTAHAGDVRDLTADYAGWAERLVMNLPHTAQEFLDAAVALAGEECLLHYYDIQHEDARYEPGEAAIRAAAEPDYDVTVETRHTVRSYAPHEYNVCLDVRLRRR